MWNEVDGYSLIGRLQVVVVTLTQASDGWEAPQRGHEIDPTSLGLASFTH